MRELLTAHGEVFLPAKQHPYAVIDEAPTEVGALEESGEPAPTGPDSGTEVG
jgi:hypothetical protein